MSLKFGVKVFLFLKKKKVINPYVTTLRKFISSARPDARY